MCGWRTWTFRRGATPNGRTVVLFHGMNFGGFYFGGPIEALRQGGFRVVVPDQIGFGRSSKPIIPYNFHDMALNSRKLLQWLGINRVIGVRALDGRDAGGALLRIVPRYGGANVLYDPIGLTDPRYERPWRTADDAYKARDGAHQRSALAGVLANIQRYFPSPGAWKPEYEQYARILYAPTLSGDWPRLAMVRAIYQQMPYLDPVVYDWANIKSRTLVMGGEKDGQDFRAGEAYRRYDPWRGTGGDSRTWGTYRIWKRPNSFTRCC